MKIKYSELNAWKEQVIEEKMQWAKVNAPDADLNAFQAGLRMGTREMIGVLKLQGKIEIDYAS